MPIDFTKYGTPTAKPTGGIDFSKYGTPAAPRAAAAPVEKGDGFFKSLVKAPLTILARPIQAVAELGGASAESIDKFSKEKLGGFVAPVPKNAVDVEKDIGRGVQTVAFGLGPVSGGAAFGFGTSLESGNKILSAQTALDTALGLGAGKLLDVVGKPLLNTAGKVIGKITPKIIEDVAAKGTNALVEFAANHDLLPKAASDVINKGAVGLEKAANKPFDLASIGSTKLRNFVGTQYPSLARSPTEDAFTRAKTNIASQYEKVLPLTPTEKAKEAMLRNKTGDNVYTTLSKNGINLGSDEAPLQLREISDQFRNATEFAQKNENGYFNVDDIKKTAFAQIEDRIPSETARTSAKDKISKEIDALLAANPEAVITDASGKQLVNSDIVERLRKTGNSWTNFNSADPEKVGQSTGYALSNAVRDQVDKEGTFPAYREANKEWGKIIHAQEVLSRIDMKGKPFKTPGGFSGSISRRILSGMFGYHTGGIGGAVLAELGSEMGAKILANPELRTYFDRQVVEKFQGKTPTPAVIKRLEAQIREYVDKQAALPRLPGPSYTPMGPKTPGESSVEIIPATKNPVSVNPKTGKFQTSYSSTPYKKVEAAPIANPTSSIPKNANITDIIPQELPKVKPELAAKAVELTKKNGGVTISLNGDVPVKGFAYSPYKDVETVIPEHQFTQKNVDNFIDAHFDKLQEPGNHLGVWTDNGKVYIDISKVAADEQAAIRDAKSNGQLALFDLSSFETKDIAGYNYKDGKYTYKKLSEINVPRRTEDGATLYTASERPKELKRTWFRGVSEHNQNGDVFSSGSKGVAGDYGHVRKLRPEELPSNPLIVDGSKESFMKEIGYNEGKWGSPFAESMNMPQKETYDYLIKKYAQKYGYNGVIYTEGSMDSPELVIFKKTLSTKPKKLK